MTTLAIEAAAGLLIFRPNGRVFLTLRSGEVLDPGVWSIPGGSIEPGEGPWEAALREGREEVGHLPVLHEIGTPHVYSLREFRYVTFPVMMDESDAQMWEPTLNWESDDWGWFEFDSLPDPVHDNVLGALNWLGYEI